MSHSVCLSLQRVVLVGLVGLGLAALATAQEAPPPSQELRIGYDSGPVANQGADRAVVISTTVHADDADWLRLFFTTVQLAGDIEDGTASILRITSHLDGHVQELNADHVGQWQNSSAYFNGDTVQVEVEASPGTGENRLILRSVSASLTGAPKSQCGAQDNRVPSFDKRTARILPIGCSAWIFDDCKHCLATAGHCSGASLQVVQFNVPPSNPDGSLNHPGPEDQYAVDFASKQWVNGGVGNDWGYFGVFPNATTGLDPFQSQTASFQIKMPPAEPGPANSLRVIGFGTDTSPATSSQAQQVASGPWTGIAGSKLSYLVDTSSGNSGSPVIHTETGSVIGVHTHGGCLDASIGSNFGTATSNAGWRTAIQYPKGVCQPVATASSYCTTKINSQFCAPNISALGLPTLSGGPGSCLIQSVLQLNQQSALLIYGTLPNELPFQGGFMCVGGTVVRTGAQNSGGSDTGLNCTGTLSFDMGALLSSGSDPNLECGATVYAQYWGRDPGFLPPNNSSLTRGLKLQIGL